MRGAAVAMVGLAILALAPAAGARPKPDEPAGGRLCNAISVEGRAGQIRSIREYGSGWAASHVRRLGRHGAFWITLHGRIGCDQFRGQLATVLLAPDELVALQTLGWRIGRIDRLRVDGLAVHRVSARKRDRRISRRSTAPSTARARPSGSTAHAGPARRRSCCGFPPGAWSASAPDIAAGFAVLRARFGFGEGRR